MTTKERKALLLKHAEQFTRHVIVDIFKQKPSVRQVKEVARKVVAGLPRSCWKGED